MPGEQISENGDAEMDDLVAKISANTGVAAEMARRAVVIILKFLQGSAPEKSAALIDAIPGAREAMAMSSDGGSSGVMGVFNDLTRAGLGMGEVQGVAKAFGGYAREKAGADAVDQVVRSIPGLSQFV
jgi:hypothetical protein